MADGRICRACAAAARPIFNGSVRSREIEHQQCDACGYVQTETPAWLDQAYGGPTAPR